MMPAVDLDPVLTEPRARAVLDAEHAWFRSYIEVLGRYRDNPIGVRVEDVGDDGAAVTVLPALARDWFHNRLLGIQRVPKERAADTIARALAAFDAAGCRAGVDTGPGHCLYEHLDALHAAGFKVGGFLRQFWGVARDTRAELDALAATGVVVRAVDGSDADREAFVRVYLASEEDVAPIPPTTLEDFGRAQSAFVDDPNWTMQVALVDGEPQAFSCLHVKPGGTVGACSGAWTHPDGRQRGAQRALLLARIGEAHRLGCELVLSQTSAALDNPSARNVQRAGLRIAWTAPFWIMPPPPPAPPA